MKSHIYFNLTSAKWIMASLLKPGVWLETKDTFFHNMPIGTHDWVVGSQHGLCQVPIGNTVKLTFSNCYPNKYTCDSGHCIPLRYLKKISYIPK